MVACFSDCTCPNHTSTYYDPYGWWDDSFIPRSPTIRPIYCGESKKQRHKRIWGEKNDVKGARVYVQRTEPNHQVARHDEKSRRGHFARKSFKAFNRRVEPKLYRGDSVIVR